MSRRTHMQTRARSDDQRFRIWRAIGYRTLAATAGATIGAIGGAICLLIYLRIQTGRREDIPAHLRRIPAVEHAFTDPHCRALENELDAARRSVGELSTFESISDYDGSIVLHSLIFDPVMMFGQSRYRFRQNVDACYLRLWTGAHWLQGTFPVTPAIANALRSCDITFRFDFRTDGNGFKPSGYPHTPGLPSVLFLGDSFTEGLWTPPSLTFVSQFGNLLAEGGIDAAALNLGASGYSAMEECWTLEHWSRALEAKVAVFNLFLNDVGNADEIQFEGHVPEESFRSMFFYLDRARDYCASNGISMAVAVIPDIRQFGDRRRLSVFQDRVRDWAGACQLKFLDPRGTFQSENVTELYIVDDGHFTPRGHIRYAQFLYDHMGEELCELRPVSHSQSNVAR